MPPSGMIRKKSDAPEGFDQKSPLPPRGHPPAAMVLHYPYRKIQKFPVTGNTEASQALPPPLGGGAGLAQGG